MGLADEAPESVVNKACIAALERWGVDEPEKHVFRNVSPLDTEPDPARERIPYPLMTFRRFGEPDPVAALDEQYQSNALFIVRASSTNIGSKGNADISDTLTEYIKDYLGDSGRLQRFVIQTDEHDVPRKVATRISVCVIEQFY